MRTPRGAPAAGRPRVTQQMIEDGLHDVGVGQGDVVVVHSSLGSLGLVEGGEDAVIDALLSCVGAPGTVCMPTLTYGNYGPRRPPPLFDPDRTPAIVGRIPERFRRRPETLRSLHPTHSLAAVGACAEDLLLEHELSPTPCGPRSPWGRIAGAGGRIVLIGVGTAVCTMFHGPEEEAEPDARCTRPVPCRLVTPEGERTYLLRLHRPYRGAVTNRAAMATRLDEAGLLRSTRVGDATVLMIEARGLWELSLRLLRARPARASDALRAQVRYRAARVLRRRR